MALVTNNSGANADMAASNQPLLMLAGNDAPTYYYSYTPPKATADYQNRIDASKLPSYRPTKTVVVGQDPAEGAFAPPGTEVKVTLAAKETLPVKIFQIGTAFNAKYGKGDVDQVLKDLDEKGQAVKPILEQEKAYESLSPSEKKAVTEYLQSGLGFTGAEADAKAAYEDVMFFHNF